MSRPGGVQSPEPSASGSPPAPHARPGCALIVYLFISLFIGGMAFGTFPATQRLAKPIVCPQAVEMVVTTDVSRGADGDSTMSSRPYCIDEDNRAWPAPGGTIFLILVGGTWIALVGLYGIRKALTPRPGVRR